MSINRGMDKMWYMYAMEYYSATKRTIAATWMNIEVVTLSELS